MYEDASADGSVVFFTTTEKLVTGDTDSRRDVFERSKDAAAGGEYVTRIVSIGPIGGNQAHDASFAGASADGSRVFFTTKESLVAGDTDHSTDVYVRDLDLNTTALVSRGDNASCTGAECGNGVVDASFAAGGVAAGGERAFFTTAEDLSPQDQDSSTDIYMRNVDTGATALVSQGAASCAGSGCGNGPVGVFFRHTSSDGSRAVFTSTEGLVAGDGDGLVDVYQRDLAGNTTSLVSSAGTCPGVLNCSAVYGGASADGSHVFFETNERIGGSDGDESADLYDWSGGTAVLASTGPDGGNGADNVTYAGNSPDGGAAFFYTDEQLDDTVDTDGARDVYRRSGGVTTLVSTGPEGGNGSIPATFRWSSSDGSAAIFVTEESLLAADTDVKLDVYERAGGTTTLLSRGDPSCGPSCGNGPYDADFARADGSRVFFVTEEPLTGGDTDAHTDVYQRTAGATTLVSTGPLNGNGPFDARLRDASEDGSLALFVTEERLTSEDDFAGEDDVYSRSTGGTLLVSTGNDPGLILGPDAPTLEGTNPQSPNESTEPAILGQADPGTEIKVYTTSDCSGEQASGPGGPAGGSAAQLATTGIPVSVGVGTTISFYATAEAEGIVSACSNAVTYTHSQESPPPPPPGEGGGGGTPDGGSTTGGTTTGTPVKTHSGGIAFVTPETQITFGPAFKTRVRRPVFRFTDETGQPGTSFLCRLDRERWRSCSSPSKLQRLVPGKHVFKVKGVNAVGIWDPQPVKRSFKVVAG